VEEIEIQHLCYFSSNKVDVSKKKLCFSFETSLLSFNMVNNYVFQ